MAQFKLNAEQRQFVIDNARILGVPELADITGLCYMGVRKIIEGQGIPQLKFRMSNRQKRLRRELFITKQHEFDAIYDKRREESKNERPPAVYSNRNFFNNCSQVLAI